MNACATQWQSLHVHMASATYDVVGTLRKEPIYGLYDVMKCDSSQPTYVCACTCVVSGCQNVPELRPYPHRKDGNVSPSCETL